MTYNIRWYDDNRQILLVTFGDEVTYQSLYEMFEACVACLDTIAHPVVIVHDLSQLRIVFSVDIVALGKITRMRITEHPNRLCSYFANPNVRAKVILDVARRLFPSLMRTVYNASSLDEALEAAHKKLAQASLLATQSESGEEQVSS